MSENNISKCPYCGSSLLQEEDGYRCRFCKSFFPFETEQSEKGTEENQLSHLKPQVVQNQETEPDPEQLEADKAFRRVRARNELIGMATAFVSMVLLFLSKTTELKILLILGLVFWAFSAGYTAFQIYKAKKAGKKAAFVRIFLLLIVAMLMLIFVHPVK